MPYRAYPKTSPSVVIPVSHSTQAVSSHPSLTAQFRTENLAFHVSVRPKGNSLYPSLLLLLPAEGWIDSAFLLLFYYSPASLTLLTSSYNKILSVVCISVYWRGTKYSLVWKERLLSTCFGWVAFATIALIWVVTTFWTPDRQRKQSCFPCRNFGKSHFSGSTQIPNPVEIFCVYPNPGSYFGQISDPESTLPDPVGKAK